MSFKSTIITYINFQPPMTNPTHPQASTLHVLIVEDMPMNQLLLKSYLSKMGHTGVVASDGEKALTCIAKFTFDIVLMDVMMPVMDGMDALKAIRAQEKTSGAHLPIIMVTGQTEEDDKARLQRAGADGFLAKPIDAKLLLAEMNRVLKGR
jgi:CheY-like chemotaxis protein